MEDTLESVELAALEAECKAEYEDREPSDSELDAIDEESPEESDISFVSDRLVELFAESEMCVHDFGSAFAQAINSIGYVSGRDDGNEDAADTHLQLSQAEKTIARLEKENATMQLLGDDMARTINSVLRNTNSKYAV